MALSLAGLFVAHNGGRVLRERASSPEARDLAWYCLCKVGLNVPNAALPRYLTGTSARKTSTRGPLFMLESNMASLPSMLRIARGSDQ